MSASSVGFERMQVVKSVLAGVLVAAVTLCGVAASVSDQRPEAKAAGTRILANRALSAFAPFQSLDEDAEDASSAPSPLASSDIWTKPPSEFKTVVRNNDDMDYIGQVWMRDHPEEAQTANIIWHIGLVMMLLALVVVIYSEASTMLFYRELDEINAAGITSAPPTGDFRRREYLWGNGWNAYYRPGMTMGGTAVLVLTMIAMFYSQCPMIDDIARHFDISNTSYSGSCMLVAIKQAVITSLGIVFFLVGIVWCCTRFLPAFLLLLLSVAGDIAGSYDGAVPVLLWICAVVGAAGLYLWVLQRPAEEPEEGRPKKKKDNLEFV